MPHSQIMSAKLVLIASVVLVGSLSSQTTSPFVGDWKRNIERSNPKPKTELLFRIRAIPGGIEIAQQGRVQASVPCDGKGRPITVPDAEHSSHTAICKLINEGTLELTTNHDNGKLISTQLVTISPDGKTMKQVWSAKAEDGSPLHQYDSVQIFDRQ